MNYPECAMTFDSQLSNGQVIHRVCLNSSLSTYYTAVSRDTCTRCCKGLPEMPTNSKPPRTTKHGVKPVPTPTPPQAKYIEAPPLVIRLKTWVEALEQWEAAGSPVRSQSQIDTIYTDHCKPCSFRRKEGNICLVCGCRIATYGFAIFNKIKMATEHCPKGKW
jgi:hypothetical protein